MDSTKKQLNNKKETFQTVLFGEGNYKATVTTKSLYNKESKWKTIIHANTCFTSLIYNGEVPESVVGKCFTTDLFSLTLKHIFAPFGNIFLNYEVGTSQR